MKRVKLENIVFIQWDSEYYQMLEEIGNDAPTNDELFSYLCQWWYPGEHEENLYNAEDINTEFLGYKYKRDDNTFLLSHNRYLGYAGLSRILGYEE